LKKSKGFNSSVIKILRAAGCPVPSNEWNGLSTDIRILAKKPGTKVSDRKNAAEYEFDVQIENCSFGILEIQRFECRLPWHSRLRPVSLLGQRNDVPDKKAYRLPSGREFPLGMVLNHRIGLLGTIKPNEMLGGLLLAYCMHRCVPNGIPEGSTVPGEISILDQHGRWHSSEIELEIDRSATMKPIGTVRPLGSGLYDTLPANLSLPIPEMPKIPAHPYWPIERART
jgi:hypothetical protein